MNFNKSKLKKYINENSYRFKHIIGVVDEMKLLLQHFDLDDKTRNELINIAFLHDIGYSEQVIKTGFHPLDGALFCKELGCTQEVITAVMFHSGAYKDVKMNFPDIMGCYINQNYKINDKSKIYIELITYCDLQRSPLGFKVSLEERLNDIYRRYGEDHNVSLTIKTNEDSFVNIIDRVNQYIKDKRLPRIK